MSEEDRTKLLTELFSTTAGAGSSLIRVCIGGSDFSMDEYTWCDKEGMANFAVHESEKTFLFPILDEIYKINPNVQIIGSPWSCPRWMKMDVQGNGNAFNSWTSGRLNPKYYADYADYFVKWVQEMQKRGYKVMGVTLQNEPLNHGNSMSLYMPWEDQRDFLKVVGPAFEKAGLKTQIMLFDHNYNYDDKADQRNYPDETDWFDYTYKTGITQNYQLGVSNVTRSYEVLNVDEYREYAKEFNINVPAGLKDETDWFDYTYKTGITQNYQLGVSGGGDKFRYYIGGGYSDEQGIIKVAYARRYNVRASFDVDMYKWLTVGANVAYSNYKNNGIISGTGANRAGVVLSVINTPTYAVVWDPENPKQYYDAFYGLGGYTTPAENMARSESNFDITDRAILTGYAQINFTKKLNFKSTVSMDRRWVHSWSYLDPVQTGYGRTQHGEATDTRSDDRRMIYDNILSYKDTFGGKHNLDVMAGTSATTSDWQQLSGSRSNFNPEYYDKIWGLGGGNKGGLRGQSTGWAQWAIMSYLGRVAYNFDSKYYLTVNFRADGSSKLAPGHKWGYFPSASAAWRLTGEDFLKDVSWLNDLKLRAGWGQQGNQSGLGDYAWVQTYGTTYYDWTNEEYAYAVPSIGGKSNFGNKYLTWETTTQTNVGIDASLFDESGKECCRA